WEELRLSLVSRLSPWEGSGAPLRAAVHSYSMTGANAHLIVEEAPAPAGEPRPGPRSAAPALPSLLSGRTDEALRAQAGRLLAALEARPELALCDVAWSLANTRTHLDRRLAILARRPGELIAALRSL